MDELKKKNTGSFYTCSSVADYIAKWAIDKAEMCILEPSFGDGVFIDAATNRFQEMGNHNPNIIGVEIQEEIFDLYMKNHPKLIGVQMDFMDYRVNTKIDAIIGNPPYISLKNLTQEAREKSFALMNSYNFYLQPSGSLWMPFIIHSTEMLEKHGKLGFVLPYEITYVRYAFDLWKYLARNFGKITICRIFRDFFPDVDVETIVFFAEEKGGKTGQVLYKVFETISDLYEDKPCNVSQIEIKDIISVNKPFERELIPNDVYDILVSLHKKNKLTRLVHDCKFKIGYVCGNKRYFHPSQDDIKNYGIQPENVKKCLLNAKQIGSNENCGVETLSISNYSFLFYPETINFGEKKYIEYGKKNNVDKGYKCSVRNPWYLTPGLEIPDVVLTVFGDTPKLLLNNGSFYVSNSLLSGSSKIENPKELICRWYNSLTLLSIELSIHSLGGGTLVLIPGETDKLEIVSEFPEDKIADVYNKISAFAKNNKCEDIYDYGDSLVLKGIYGFTDMEITKIKNAVLILRNWRNTEKRRG